MFNSIPSEITTQIYEFDPTYKNILDQSLQLIDQSSRRIELKELHKKISENIIEMNNKLGEIRVGNFSAYQTQAICDLVDTKIQESSKMFKQIKNLRKEMKNFI